MAQQCGEAIQPHWVGRKLETGRLHTVEQEREEENRVGGKYAAANAAGKNCINHRSSAVLVG